MNRSLSEIFESAIDDGHGQVDAGYLAIGVALIVTLAAVVLMCFGAIAQVWLSSDHRFPVQELGTGIGAAFGGFGVVCGAVGAFRWGDRDRPPQFPRPQP